MEEAYNFTFCETVGLVSARVWINRMRLRSRKMDGRERTLSGSNRYDLQGVESSGLGGRVGAVLVIGGALQRL